MNDTSDLQKLVPFAVEQHTRLIQDSEKLKEEVPQKEEILLEEELWALVHLKPTH